jgi:LysR family transcriptional regulator, regulator for metE and metH
MWTSARAWPSTPARAGARGGGLVISSDPEDLTGVVFNPLFDYHPTFVASANHPLAAKALVEAEDFRDQTLITYPVSRDKLDIFTELLTPAKVEPRGQRRWN